MIGVILSPFTTKCDFAVLARSCLDSNNLQRPLHLFWHPPSCESFSQYRPGKLNYLVLLLIYLLSLFSVLFHLQVNFQYIKSCEDHLNSLKSKTKISILSSRNKSELWLWKIAHNVHTIFGRYLKIAA